MGRHCEHIAGGIDVRDEAERLWQPRRKEGRGEIFDKVFVWFMILAFYATLAAPLVHAAWVALQ